MRRSAVCRKELRGAVTSRHLRRDLARTQAFHFGQLRLAASRRTCSAKGASTKTTTRSTSSSTNRLRAAAWMLEDTVTTNVDGSPPESARAARATSRRFARRGPPDRLTPSATRPAKLAIFGPKPPTTIGGGGSGRRKPPTESTVPDHTDRKVATAASTAARLAASPGTGRPRAYCSSA